MLLIEILLKPVGGVKYFFPSEKQLTSQLQYAWKLVELFFWLSANEKMASFLVSPTCTVEQMTAIVIAFWINGLIGCFLTAIKNQTVVMQLRG